MRSVFLRFFLALTLTLQLGCSRSSDDSDWPNTFGYSPSEIVAVEIDSFGFPNIPVTIGDDEVWLPFDTGNMVGVSLSTALFDELGLDTVRTYNRVNGAGELVATLRVSEGRPVQVTGKTVGRKEIHEFDHSTLPGLFGPADLETGHFTLDYSTRRLAAGSTPLPRVIHGYSSVPMVRSERFPALILVQGTIEGHSVVMELDTGKSRTVVNPGLVSELDLKPTASGVRVESIQIGNLSYSVRSAKEVDQTAIDTGSRESIMVGVGSDILSQFVWTVDYETGVLWLPSERD